MKQHLKWSNAIAYVGEITTTVKNLTRTINSTVNALFSSAISFILFDRIQFDFSDYIRRLYRSAGITLADDDTVVIGRISDIRSIAKILSQYPSKTIFTYMMARFLSTHHFHLSKSLRILAKDSFLTDLSEDETRELACAKFVNKHMGYAVSKLYINKYFDKKARQEVILFEFRGEKNSRSHSIDFQATELVENVRETFIEMIRTSTWMDAISKKRTTEKVRHLQEERFKFDV